MVGRMDNTIILLNKLLDATSVRHQVLANNLANVNTVGYKRHDVHFKDALVSALKSESRPSERAMEIASVEPEFFEDEVTPARADGNNVSTQVELGEISQNELLYRVSTKALSMKYERLKKAMGGSI